MAKGAANEKSMGALHTKITAIFLKVLQTYETRLDAIENLSKTEFEDEIEAAMIEKLFDDGAVPNPAMLSAITKFLKDNDVTFEIEKLDEISETQKRLQERARNRPNLSNLKVVGE